MRSFEVKLIEILVLVAIFLSHDRKKTIMAIDQDCLEDIAALEQWCLIFIGEGPAPPPVSMDHCCDVIKAMKESSIPCWCSHFTDRTTSRVPGPKPRYEDMFDWRRVLKVFNTCGRPFAPGTKCGHFVAPPA